MARGLRARRDTARLSSPRSCSRPRVPHPMPSPPTASASRCSGPARWPGSSRSSRRTASTRRPACRSTPPNLASTEAGKIALKGGSADIILSDWLWVARERSLGDSLVFYPSSSTLGAVMVPRNRRSRRLADLKGRKLAVAGGPLDKSWLLLQALARRIRSRSAPRGHDRLRRAAAAVAEGGAGRKRRHADVLEFLRRAEGRGQKRAIRMDDVMSGLGAAGPVAIVGYTFDGGWAARNGSAVDRFLEAARQAKEILAGSDAEWQRLAPRIGVHDANALAIYRQRYREGIVRRPLAEEEADARDLYRVLAEIGGAELVGAAATSSSRHVLPPGSGRMNVAAAARSRSDFCWPPGSSARSSRARGCCRSRRRSRSRSSTKRTVGALFFNLGATLRARRGGVHDRHAARHRDRPRHGPLAVGRPARRSLAGGAAQPAGAGDHRARLCLGRPDRDRGDRGGRAQQAADRDRHRARRRALARPRARRHGAGVPHERVDAAAPCRAAAACALSCRRRPLRAIAGVEDRADRRIARTPERGRIRDRRRVPTVRRDPYPGLCSRFRRRHAGDRNVPGAAA